MDQVVRAIRGATTLDADTAEQVSSRVGTLVRTILERNGLAHDDLVSVLLTATDDIVSMYPATAARAAGLRDVPLLGARELAVEGGTPLCIRVMVHAYTARPRNELHHIYLEGARGLRHDLPA